MKFKNYQITLLLTIITLFTACKEDTTVPKSTAKAISKLVFAQFTPAVLPWSVEPLRPLARCPHLTSGESNANI